MKFFKIIVFVPEDFLNQMMEQINDVIEPLEQNYDYAFSFSKVSSTWRPLEGSTPCMGEINKIQKVEEIKLEFSVKEQDLKNVLQLVRNIHPYEIPVIEVYPLHIYADFLIEKEN